MSAPRADRLGRRACGIVGAVEDRPVTGTIWDVVSRREARLLFWLVVIALFAVIATLGSQITRVLATPAIILFVAWLMAYVLEPFVSLLHRHMPFKGRGLRSRSHT